MSSETLYMPHARRDIGVFWDAEECPIPSDPAPAMIFDVIQSAVESKGYPGKLNIFAYSETKPSSPALLPECGNTDIPFFIQGDKDKRVTMMVFDILFWALNNPYPFKSTLMLITNNISEELISVCLSLKVRGYSVLLTKPAEDPSEFFHSVDDASADCLHTMLMEAENSRSGSGTSVADAVLGNNLL